jgi:predicted PurR-regulated permease PerM
MSAEENSLDESAEAPVIVGPDAMGLAKWQRLLTVTATLLSLFAVCAITCWLGMAIHHTILLFALGGLTAYALSPVVDLVCKIRIGKQQRQLSKTAGVLTVYAAMFVLFAGAAWWLGGQAAHEVKVLQDDAPKYRTRAIGLAHDLDTKVLQPRGIEFSVEQTIQNPPKEATVYAERLSSEALPILEHTLTTVAESGVVLLIALYLLIFASDMKERANQALPPSMLVYALPWEQDVNRILGGFVRGQFMLALINGACAAIGLFLLGVHLWLLIGAFVVVASLIPVFGPYIASIPAILAALIAPTHLTPVAGAIAVLVLFVIINEVGSKVLYPKLVGQALNLHEVVVLFVLFAGLELDGIVGTLFAAPVASLTVVTLVHLYRLWQELPEGSIADDLQRRIQGRRRDRKAKSAKSAPTDA